MKKGFTMIEVIFVIVILGILASVAIPRLAGTREDAEISAAVANLRTLLGDAASYYVVKGSFTDAKWAEITSVPLKQNATGDAMNNEVDATRTAYLKVGDSAQCIGVNVVNKAGNAPAYIHFTRGSGDLCTKVLDSKPVAAYYTSAVKGTNGNIANAIAIGSNTKIY